MTTRNKERPKKSDAKTRVVLLALRKTLFHAILDNFILLQFLALLFVLAAVYWSAAKVVRLEKFGAFVNLFGNTDGLLHISKISHHRVEKVEDVLKLGDVIDVKVTEIDNKGRINVSAKALLPKPKTEDNGRFHPYGFGTACG